MIAREYVRDITGLLKTFPYKQVETVANMIIDARRDGNTIFLFGNGGSASTASHFACDLSKGTIIESNDDSEKRIRVVCLSDNIPTMLAYANDYSYEYIFFEQLINLVRPRDIVIGFSVSGNSPNVLKAIEYANFKGIRTVGFTGKIGGQLNLLAKTVIKFNSFDFGKVEDLHLMASHIIARIVKESGKKK